MGNGADASEREARARWSPPPSSQTRSARGGSAPPEPGSAAGLDGAPELITSRRNPLIRQLRSLHDTKGRRELGLLLLEGTHLLEEARQLQLVPDRVVATPDWIARHEALWRGLPPTTQRTRVSAEVLTLAASTSHPDGVLATLPPPAPAPGRRPGFVLALDALQDPGNLGTLLRTALAAGVEEVWLADGADPYSPKVLRASSGAALALPLRRLGREALLERLQGPAAAGLRRVATLVSGGQPYWELDWTEPTLLLLGNEGAGLHPALAALADARVTIPHSPSVESLNVAVAAAPLLLERWRQSGSTPGERMPDIPRSSTR